MDTSPSSPLAVATLVFLLTGCGGGVAKDSPGAAEAGIPAKAGTPDADGGFSSFADAGTAAAVCAHYFAAQSLHCGGARLPASEMARVEARFVQVCLNGMALPGSGMTADSVEACAAALDASACELPDGEPVACNFSGTLPGGAPCNEGFQCQSGGCLGTAFLSPEGQIGPTTCGACAPFVEDGAVCAHAMFSGGCASDEICLIGPGMETAAQPTYTCVRVTHGDTGATCDGLAASCKPGLYCAAQTGKCAALGDAGAACGEGASPPGNPGGCAAPLACVGLQGMATCSLGGAGAFCLRDVDCAAGLGCIPGPCSPTIARIGCGASGTCGPVTWAAPGQPCDGYSTRCLVGDCGAPRLTPPRVGPDGGVMMLTCPAVTADGQPCAAQCDTLAECFATDSDAGGTGACVLPDGVVCR
jgi:hypothetical protein